LGCADAAQPSEEKRARLIPQCKTGLGESFVNLTLGKNAHTPADARAEPDNAEI